MTEIALDYSRYQSFSYTPEVVSVDIAALAVEAMDTEDIAKRVWPYRFELRSDGSVICPEVGDKDIAGYFSRQTEAAEKETIAGLKIKQALIDEPDGTSIVWLSPPSNHYPEGRITIGQVKWENNLKVMHCYGIPVDFSVQVFNQLAGELSQYGDDDIGLRSRIFILRSTKNQSSWEELKNRLPLGEIWEAIESKQADMIKQKVLRDARLVAESMPVYLHQASPIRAGAYLERGMERRGHRINGVKSGCGHLNKDLVSISPARVLDSPHGLVEKSSEGTKVYVKSCGKCSHKIGKFMTPGKDRCPHCNALFPKLC